MIRDVHRVELFVFRAAAGSISQVVLQLPGEGIELRHRFEQAGSRVGHREGWVERGGARHGGPEVVPHATGAQELRLRQPAKGRSEESRAQLRIPAQRILDALRTVLQHLGVAPGTRQRRRFPELLEQRADFSEGSGRHRRHYSPALTPAGKLRVRSMAGRTIAIGDIHGELNQLRTLMAKLPRLDKQDTLVFLGDYIDRGPHSKQVVEYVRYLPRMLNAKIVALRGNHEDAWLRVRKHRWPEFVRPPHHGCLPAYRSFINAPLAMHNQEPIDAERDAFESGRFFPRRIVEWLENLPYWYEDEHAIYVHAGLPRAPHGGFAHPSELPHPPVQLLWLRDEDFFRNYRGKRVVFGHTNTELLPPELSAFTPDDPKDLWSYENVVGIDTGCGRGGFLTAVELPSMTVYESR